MTERAIYLTPEDGQIEVPESGDMFTVLSLISKMCISGTVDLSDVSEPDEVMIELGSVELDDGTRQYTKVEEHVSFGGRNKVGAGTQIGARSVIGRGTSFGMLNRIGPTNIFGEHVSVDSNNTIARLNSFKNGSEIGYHNQMGEFNTFSEDASIGNDNVFGNSNKLHNNVMIDSGNLVGSYNSFTDTLAGMRDRVVGDEMVVVDPADTVVWFDELPLNLIEPGLTASGYVIPIDQTS